MPASKAEQVLDVLKALLEEVPDAVVERNSALPEKVPAGGFEGTYYQHAVEIEVYVDEGDASARDAAFDGLLQQIGAALEADPTVGGLAFGLTCNTRNGFFCIVPLPTALSIRPHAATTTGRAANAR